MRIFVLVFLTFCATLEAAKTNDILLEKQHHLKIGLLCAHPKELGSLLSEMEVLTTSKEGLRDYYEGNLWGIPTVLTVSRVGKVAAATTTTHLIVDKKVDLIILVGTSGALESSLNQGDICIGTTLIQHDLDCRPFIPQGAIPLLNQTALTSDEVLVSVAQEGAHQWLQSQKNKISKFNLSSLKILQGLILTGDQFITSESQVHHLKEVFPEALCVDMESAALAQCCFEYEVPFVVIRLISDRCNGSSALHCKDFMENVSPLFCREILSQIYQKMNQLIEVSCFM